MKKYIVSAFLIVTFAVYAIYQRISDGGDVVVMNPSINDVPIKTVIKTTPVIPISAPPTPTQTPTTVPTPAPTPVPVKKVVNIGLYKDGSYTGDSADAYYGNIQVEAVISGGKITDVQFLDYPQDRNTSVRINTYAMPRLRQEAIQAQSANVNTVSGASDSSGAFRQSLSSALAQARN